MAIFTNQAILSYKNGAVSSNIVTGEIVEVLSATKNALLDTYSPGDTVTFVVGLFNSGSTPLSGVTLTDDLGAYPFGGSTLVPLTYVSGSLNYFVNGILQPTPTVSAGTDLTVSGLTIPANGYAQVIYEARVNDFAPVAVGGEIVNNILATVGGESAVAQETITAAEAPILAITKAVEPATVSENGTLTYTFTLQNLGNTAAVVDDALVVTDTFDPILDPITVTYNGTAWTEGVEYTYDTATGIFSTVAGNITLPAATYTQDPTTGAVTTVPGVTVLTVSGTV